MTCYVCPVCTYRWRIIPDGIDRDAAEVCSNCACNRCQGRGTIIDRNGLLRPCPRCEPVGA